MIRNDDMLCSWREFVRLRYRNKTLIVFKYFKKYSWIWNMDIKDKYASFISPIKCITSCIACINALYYASVALKEIYVCNLHNNGHPTYVITYPIRNTKISALSSSA